jgi:hypothetical protein
MFTVLTFFRFPRNINPVSSTTLQFQYQNQLHKLLKHVFSPVQAIILELLKYFMEACTDPDSRAVRPRSVHRRANTPILCAFSITNFPLTTRHNPQIISCAIRKV